MTFPPTLQIITSVEFMTQTTCRLMQGGVYINTITCALEIYSHFKFVDEGTYYIYFKLYNVVCTRCMSAQNGI